MGPLSQREIASMWGLQNREVAAIEASALAKLEAALGDMKLSGLRALAHMMDGQEAEDEAT
jgi:transcriptional regulator